MTTRQTIDACVADWNSHDTEAILGYLTPTRSTRRPARHAARASISRYEGGKVVRHPDHRNLAAMLVQIGVLLPPA